MDTYVSKRTILNELIEWKKSCVEAGHYETAADLKLIISEFEKMQSDLITCQNCRYWRLNYYQDIETCSEHRNVDGTEQATPPDFTCSWGKRRDVDEFDEEDHIFSMKHIVSKNPEQTEYNECTNCQSYNFIKNGIHAGCPITGIYDDCEKLRKEDAEKWK